MTDPAGPCPFPPGYTLRQPAPRADALAFGTRLVVIDQHTGGEVWAVTVGAPEDITAAVSDHGDAAPINGAYVAVPVELTNLGAAPVDLAIEVDRAMPGWLLTGDGGHAQPVFVAEDRYPSRWDLPAIQPGDTVRYYEVFDVAAGVAATGYYVFQLPAGPEIYSGPTG